MKQMKYGLLFLGMFCLLVVTALGCESSYKAKKPEAVKAAEKTQAVEKQKAEDAKKLAEAQAEKTNASVDDATCWGKEDKNKGERMLTIAGQGFKLVDDYTLKAINPDVKKPLVIGDLTDIKSNIAKNMANLDYFYQEFQKAGVNAVVVSGDTSEKYHMLKPLFEYFGQKGILTMVIIGNREMKDDYTKAIKEAQKKFPNLVNLNVTRVVDLGLLSFVSLPGYYDPNYIHNGPGCAYGATHVDQVKKLVQESKNPVALISHGPPRGKGPNAIDNAIEAGNVGDPRITQLIKETKVPFGFFGNIHEAGGRAVDGDGFNNKVEENKFVSNLYIHPGPADSDPWKMNDGTISRGMAGIVTVKADDKGGVVASYKIIKAK